jgi:hypothetical protein
MLAIRKATITPAIDKTLKAQLTTGCYSDTEKIEDDRAPFEDKMPRFDAELHSQFAESAKLEPPNLTTVGF